MSVREAINEYVTEGKHGGHPISNLAYVFIIGVIAGLGVMVTELATGSTTGAIIGGVVLAVSLVGAVTIMVPMTRRYHHNPLVPDATEDEVRHYLEAHPR